MSLSCSMCKSFSHEPWSQKNIGEFRELRSVGRCWILTPCSEWEFGWSSVTQLQRCKAFWQLWPWQGIFTFTAYRVSLFQTLTMTMFTSGIGINFQRSDLNGVWRCVNDDTSYRRDHRYVSLFAVPYDISPSHWSNEDVTTRSFWRLSVTLLSSRCSSCDHVLSISDSKAAGWDSPAQVNF